MPTAVAAGAVQLKDNIVPIEISEYAGYAGLIAANGGLEPTENSVFFKNHGFKVKLTVSEDENWSRAERGQDRRRRSRPSTCSPPTAGSSTPSCRRRSASRAAPTASSSAATSSGSTQLKGKTIATAQFTEVDFFIRYLAQEAGLGGQRARQPRRDAASRIASTWSTPRTASAPAICSCTTSSPGKNRLAGCVTWEPKVSEVVERQRRPGARADHQPQPAHRRRRADRAPRLRRAAPEDRRGPGAGPARRQPHGARSTATRISTSSAARSSGRATTTASELAKVHLSNLPENLAFFSGAIDAAGSFGGIYQSAVLAYGSDLIKDPPDAERFVDLAALQALEKSGPVQGSEGRDRADPHRAAAASLETNPLLSKDIRFLFEPNSSTLDLSNQDEHQEPRGDQEAAAGQPGLDDPAARPRRQRAGRASSASRAARPSSARRRCGRWS